MRALVRKNLCDAERDIEGTAGHDLLNAFPNAACHDGDNYVFPRTSDLAVNPIIASELYPEDATVDQEVFIVARLLMAEDRTRHIHLTNSDCKALFNHPAWRLWCCKYDEDNAYKLASDWAYMKNLIGESWPDYDASYDKDKIRGAMRSILG